ncbi:MAG: isocitrate lyase/phosphoenolpyruvate mutase family protein [Planctomycetota bacterium]
MPTPASRLRTQLQTSVTAAPGAFNGLVARSVANAGFNACYVSGGAASAAAGVPDVGLLTLDRFAQTVREVADASDLPVIADADTGFGEEEMVRRTVIEYARNGAAALHLEDQVFPKRCGHLDGKSLIPTDQMQSKVAFAAEAAKHSADPDFIVCARTDAKSVEGFDHAVNRAAAYLDAGAHMIFPEGLTSETEFGLFAERLRDHNPAALLLANMTEFGKTPHIPVARFGELGYHLVIYPVSTLRVAMHAVEAFLSDLHDHGSAEAWQDRMQHRKDLYQRLGYAPGEPWHFPNAGEPSS